jgi:hypothetical protein
MVQYPDHEHGFGRALYVEEDGESPLVNVEAVTVSDSDLPTTFTVYTSGGVPNYRVTATQTLIDELNARPKAAEDFINGTRTIEEAK